MSDNTYNFEYRSPRFPADLSLLVQTSGTPPLLLDGRCVDISKEGLRATFRAPLEVGSHVTLVMRLPGGSIPVRIAARLIRCEDDEHGFTFIFSSQKERDCIEGYIESLHSRKTRSAGSTS